MPILAWSLCRIDRSARIFAEFEPEMIRERVCAGLEKARANGKRLGRPTVPASVEHSIRAARQTGKGSWQLPVSWG